MKPETIGADSATTVWTIDPQYATVEFSSKMLFFKVKGCFTDFGGQITLDENATPRASNRVSKSAMSICARRTFSTPLNTRRFIFRARASDVAKIETCCASPGR
jgi:hypothetical protein